MNEIEVNGKKYVLKSEVKNPAKKNLKGLSYCIIRTYSAGVFAGYFDRKVKGKEGTIFNARRIWYWDGASTISEMANEGVSKPENCKFPSEVNEIDLKEIIEVIPCTEKARLSITGVKIWSQK